MGIEFYGFFQARINGQWKEVGRFDHFNSAVQHWLAPWEDLHGRWGINPISPWRGAPPDFSVPGMNECDYTELLLLPTKTYCEISWLSAEEILESLPILEMWMEDMDQAEFEKKSNESYWDFRHAYWVEAPPRLVSARKLNVVPAEGSEKFKVEFITDRSEEARSFTGQVSKLQRDFQQVRFIFYCESDW
ncbi:hypothetical protein ACSFBI_33480 [Variovorax sp. RB3P1]|uniref:hypothetical protein n=1 Tax=Variovorax sp. RB3P1 TaxID=3443732 RepID=UPI003F47905D